jgi:hypothetical protein
MFKLFHLKISAVLSILLFGLLLFVLSVKAAEVQNSQEISSAVQVSSLKNATPDIFRDERLSETEWAEYRQWMQGPDGLWYPQLSPAAVLGLHAETELERRHFADLVAQEQHDKIAREILFNHAVYLAMRRLYPAEPIIQPFDKTPFNPQKKRGNQS